ncbi:MAG TPA: AraC family ligand binding domain-containing protein [Candidatus Caccousia avicola]|uniref:AraC family ligand binding domain-containing protein n=1 Tax=Candidatus Caccousia avicola TaxID=2840721 RepID=A0A9D1APF4_9FIRM|nr:AraC family ligand binding domain-containing protein [Candidatus Caccousia avicola]
MNKTDGTENRRLILFSELGIPHLLSLGRVELLAHTQMCLLPHIHPDQFEICFHYDGQQEYVVEDIPYLTQSGDLFITYPNEEHSSGSSGEEKSPRTAHNGRCGGICSFYSEKTRKAIRPSLSSP